MKVIFEAEVRDNIDGYSTIKDKVGEIVHYYENDNCLVHCKDDNMLYKVSLKKIKIIEKKGFM